MKCAKHSLLLYPFSHFLIYYIDMMYIYVFNTNIHCLVNYVYEHRHPIRATITSNSLSNKRHTDICKETSDGIIYHRKYVLWISRDEF